MLVDDEKFEESVKIWMQTFKSVLKRKSMYKSRLTEFLTWDDCKGDQYNHAVKIEALKRLIKK